MELVINELSYLVASSELEAQKWYDTFFGLCLQMEKDHHCKIVLKYSSPIQDFPFHHSCVFRQWLKDQNMEARTSILAMLTQLSSISEYPYYKVYGAEGKGIGYAYENDHLLISIQSDSKWEVTSLTVVKETLNEETLEIELEEKCIHHCFNNQSRISHDNYISQKVKYYRDNKIREIVDGDSLWKKRKEHFPDIIFCDSVKDNVVQLPQSSFKSLRERLNEFQEYFSQWNKGDFDYKAISGDVRLESDTRLNDFTRQLKLKCPDGVYRLFTYHCNWWQWGYRMHFYPDYTSHKCIIGYIGKKII